MYDDAPGAGVEESTPVEAEAEGATVVAGVGPPTVDVISGVGAGVTPVVALIVFVTPPEPLISDMFNFRGLLRRRFRRGRRMGGGGGRARVIVSE